MVFDINAGPFECDRIFLCSIVLDTESKGTKHSTLIKGQLEAVAVIHCFISIQIIGVASMKVYKAEVLF